MSGSIGLERGAGPPTSETELDDSSKFLRLTVSRSISTTSSTLGPGGMRSGREMREEAVVSGGGPS